MKTSASLPRNKVLCALRKKWVVATPEERVRQGLIGYLTKDLGYPLGNFAIETPLKDLADPSLNPPSRRIDLLFTYKQGSSLKPLILFECKQGDLDDDAIRQVISYNVFIKAPYIALANDQRIRVASGQGVPSLEKLPHFSHLNFLFSET